MSKREIIDESDVYIDVHKAIRRLTPAPKARLQRRQSEDQYGNNNHGAMTGGDGGHDSLGIHKAVGTIGTASHESPQLSSSPRLATLMMRRGSSGLEGQSVTIPVRANFEDIRQHLKHLGPSNPATNPKNTRSTTVKIKPGTGVPGAPRASVGGEATEEVVLLEEELEGDETTSLLRPQVTGKDGIQALHQTYGSGSPDVTVHLASPANGEIPTLTLETADQVRSTPSKRSPTDPTAEAVTQRSVSNSTSIDSLRNDNNNLVPKRGNVRSGSITENIVESRGVRKVVLETTSSNDDDESEIIASSSPEHSKPQSRTSFGLFASRDNHNGRPQSSSSRTIEGDEGEEDIHSPDAGNESASGPSGAATTTENGGGGGGKKKNRRKKRKAGKS